MTRLRAVPEPFIAIVFGLLIGVAANIFSIDPGALRNMQVRTGTDLLQQLPRLAVPFQTNVSDILTLLFSPAPFSSTFYP